MFLQRGAGAFERIAWPASTDLTSWPETVVNSCVFRNFGKIRCRFLTELMNERRVVSRMPFRTQTVPAEWQFGRVALLVQAAGPLKRHLADCCYISSVPRE